MRARCALAALAATLGAIALWSPVSAGAASHPLQTSLQDASTFGDHARVNLSMQRMRQAGASWVRVDLTWNRVAPSAIAKPAGFNAADPGDPQYDWEGVDWAIRSAVANGLQPFVNISEAPAWAQRGTFGRFGTVNPDPAELAAFAYAAATRYSGRYAGLPRVSAWEVWNEVNASFFFVPQWKGKTGGEALSPVLYRQMVNEFADAVHAVDRSNLVIAGSLYPFAADRPTVQAIAPLKFMRYLFCLSAKLGVIPNCGEPLHLDAFSHHPYTSGSPTHETLASDSISIGQLPRMAKVLHAAVRHGRVVSSRPIQFWVTEFGWDTNPPDPQGVPVRLQARWVSEALFRMWRAGVSVASWFQMRDGYGGDARFADGLYRICPDQPENLGCDRTKLSFESFRFPFVAFRHRHGRILIWGRTPGSIRRKVVVEQSRGGAFKAVAKLRTGRYGIFQRTLRTRHSGNFRARLADGTIYSLPFSLKRPRDFPISPPVG
jgi:hypothetical protein